MKKLVLLTIVALSGLSLSAMDSTGVKLEGEAKAFYDGVKSNFVAVTADQLSAVIDQFPGLPNWKTQKRKPFLHLFVGFNNYDVVRFLLNNGADASKLFRKQTAKQLAESKDDKQMVALFTEFERDGKCKVPKLPAAPELDSPRLVSRFFNRTTLGLSLLTLLGFGGYRLWKKRTS